MTWIDKTAPTAEVEYSTTSETYGDVVATIIPSEEIREKDLTYTFNENGSYTFSFTDKMGNIGSATATVDWILKREPKDRVEFTIDGSKVTANLIFEETIPPMHEELFILLTYRKAGVMVYAEQLNVTDMQTEFIIPKQYENDDIYIYVWDKNLRPLMDVQKLN